MRRLGITMTILYPFLKGVIAGLAIGAILIGERIYREGRFSGHDASRVGARLARFLPRPSGS